MIRAIIFDCFGVLTTDGWLRFTSQHFSGDDEKALKASLINQACDRGEISHATYVQELAGLAGISEDAAKSALSQHVQHTELFGYIRDQLKPDYEIGLLSNASANWLPELFEPWQIALFDAMVFSFELGVIKPHPLMYHTVADKLGRRPDECMFIDDREVFCQGARDCGMVSVQFTSNERVQQTIEGL